MPIAVEQAYTETSVNMGVVTAVRGSIVDVTFDVSIPAIHNVIYAQNRTITLEVVSQLSSKKVRTIALTPTQGLARGMPAEDMGQPVACKTFGY